jgi:lactate racemase
MPSINLRYGRDEIPFEYDENRFTVLRANENERPLSDLEIDEKLSTPIASPTIEEIVKPGDSVLIVVPDATRRSGAGQIVNILVRRLIANGSVPFDIKIIFATGIHRKVSEDEKSSILTPFIAQRINTLDHDPRDLAKLVRVGETSAGIEVSLNRGLVETDHVALVGSITFHYFAGFTGSRKLVCPGLASSQTIASTHKLAFDCTTKGRRDGVATGTLDGNPVHEAFVEAASFAKPSFAVNAVVNSTGDVTDISCGHWVESHRAACEQYAHANTVAIAEKRDIVIVSCGGDPYDVNLIQAHKALEAASHACREGGEIILLAECREGLGRDDFLKWFEASDSSKLGDRLCERYQVNGQTAWSLLRKAERFRIRLVTRLDLGSLSKMRMTASDFLETRSFAGTMPGYIIPAGAKIMIRS